MSTYDNRQNAITDPGITARPNSNLDEKNLTSTEMAAAVLLAGLLSLHHIPGSQSLTTSSAAQPTVNPGNSTQATGQDPTNQGIPHMKPTDGYITCEFHQGHPGVDFHLVPGSSIRSTMNGEVTFSGWKGSILGNAVVITNGKFSTCFAHLATTQVNVGEWIHAGTEIGTAGKGERTGGEYLHYEVRVDGKPENPDRFFGRRVNNFHS